MDTKYALQRIERNIYNQDQQKIYDAMELVLIALDEFRKAKRLNQSHITKLMEKLKGNGIVHGASLGAHQYWKGDYQFTVYYSQLKWNDYSSEPHKGNEHHSITLKKDELSGEQIYQKIKEQLEAFKKHRRPAEDIEDYERFYVELEELCGRHVCSKDALYQLSQR